MKQIYLDNAATTEMDSSVFNEMLGFLKENYGNPSSFHKTGKKASDAIEGARKNIAQIINCQPGEIVFTSGGTEADNLAILGIARANKMHGNHLIISAIEHHAVLEAAYQLEKNEGFEVTYIETDENGVVLQEKIMRAIRPETILVSIMLANNETGIIQPVSEIGNAIQKYRLENESAFPVFHTDAVQGAGYMDLDIAKLHVDLMTINGSKIYGPKGVGALYMKKGLKIQPLQYGGGQEKGLRPGTQNVPGIIGLAAALQLVQQNFKEENERITNLRDKLITGLLQIPEAFLNGSQENRLPNNANISFKGIDAEALLLYLDAEGIYVSTGAACTSASVEPSHVLIAMGIPKDAAKSSIRFSLSKNTTEQEIDYVIEIVPKIITQLRSVENRE